MLVDPTRKTDILQRNGCIATNKNWRGHEQNGHTTNNQCSKSDRIWGKPRMPNEHTKNRLWLRLGPLRLSKSYLYKSTITGPFLLIIRGDMKSAGLPACLIGRCCFCFCSWFVLVSVLGLYLFLCSLAARFCFVWIKVTPPPPWWGIFGPMWRAPFLHIWQTDICGSKRCLQRKQQTWCESDLFSRYNPSYKIQRWFLFLWYLMRLQMTSSLTFLFICSLQTWRRCASVFWYSNQTHMHVVRPNKMR